MWMHKRQMHIYIYAKKKTTDFYKTKNEMCWSCDVRNWFLNRISTECAFIAIDCHTIYKLTEYDLMRSRNAICKVNSDGANPAPLLA